MSNKAIRVSKRLEDELEKIRREFPDCSYREASNILLDRMKRREENRKFRMDI